MRERIQDALQKIVDLIVNNSTEMVANRAPRVEVILPPPNDLSIDEIAAIRDFGVINEDSVRELLEQQVHIPEARANKRRPPKRKAVQSPDDSNSEADAREDNDSRRKKKRGA
jgi:hypothetical protein